MGIGLGRRRRKSKKDASSHLDLESNAWWADRETLSRAYGTDPAPDPEPTAEDDGSFETEWQNQDNRGGNATDRDGRVDSVAGGRRDDRSTTNADPAKQIFVFPDGVDPFGTLGLEQGVDWDGVVAAHRSLVKRYHPDRYGTAGPDEQAAAELRMSEINAAFQQLGTLYDR